MTFFKYWKGGVCKECELNPNMWKNIKEWKTSLRKQKEDQKRLKSGGPESSKSENLEEVANDRANWRNIVKKLEIHKGL